jgi:hypothetical protein
VNDMKGASGSTLDAIAIPQGGPVHMSVMCSSSARRRRLKAPIATRR